MGQVRVIEELSFSLTYSQQSLGRDAEHLHHQTQLIRLVLAREDWVPDRKLNHHTSKRPHVDCWSVRNAQYNFRGAVESGLDVSVYSLPLETARAKINYFYP